MTNEPAESANCKWSPRHSHESRRNITSMENARSRAKNVAAYFCTVAKLRVRERHAQPSLSPCSFTSIPFLLLPSLSSSSSRISAIRPNPSGKPSNYHGRTVISCSTADYYVRSALVIKSGDRGIFSANGHVAVRGADSLAAIYSRWISRFAKIAGPAAFFERPQTPRTVHRSRSRIDDRSPSFEAIRGDLENRRRIFLHEFIPTVTSKAQSMHFLQRNATFT